MTMPWIAAHIDQPNSFGSTSMTARRRHLLGTARDVARRPLGLRSELGMAFVNRRIDLEHDAIGVGILEGEGKIGLAGQPPALGRVGDAGRRLLERVGELAEGLGAHRRQDVGLVLEIAIGRLGAAAQRLGELAHGDALVAEAGEALGRDPAQLGAEVGDVLVGEITRHEFPYTVCRKRLSSSNIRSVISNEVEEMPCRRHEPDDDLR